MTNPNERRPLAVRRDEILELARRLMDNIGNLDLDTIDGEFYWRCCRPDFASAVRRARAQFPKMSTRTIPIEIGRAVVESVLHRLHAAFNIPQPFLLDHIVNDAPIPMRGYAITNQLGTDPEVREPYDNLLIKITSPNMTGADVERAVRAWYRLPNDQFGGSWFDPMSLFKTNAEAATAIYEFIDYEHERFKLPRTSVLVSFDLIFKDPPRMDPGPVGFFGRACLFVVAFGDVPPPYVEITVGLPLPSAGVLADLYDALVRHKHQWHRELAGTVSRQNKEVAIRTWTVCLLTSRSADEPMNFREAMRAYEAATQRGQVKQPKFQGNRVELIERVPEAADYVFARKRRKP
jgi:hypothetical protein